MKKNLDPKRPLFVTVERDGTPAEKQAARKLDAALTRLVEDYGYASVLRGIARLSTEAVSRPAAHAADTMLNLDAVRKECWLIGFRVFSCGEKIRLRASDYSEFHCYIEVTPDGKFEYHRGVIPEAKGPGNIARRNDVIEAVEKYEARVGTYTDLLSKDHYVEESLSLLKELFTLLASIDAVVGRYVVV